MFWVPANALSALVCSAASGESQECGTCRPWRTTARELAGQQLEDARDNGARGNGSAAHHGSFGAAGEAGEVRVPAN